MKVTLLGTANPCPQLERAGTSIAVEVGGAVALVDCGPMAVYRCIEHGVDVSTVEEVFFTHHHADHNLGFFHFAIASWFLGRRALRVYGPAGTDDLLAGLETAYGMHIDSWTDGELPPTGIEDVETVDVAEGFELADDRRRVRTTPVSHSLETFGYRFDDLETGASFAFSSDTAKDPRVAELAEGVDLLVHCCNAEGRNETPRADETVPERYREPPFDAYYEGRYSDAMNQHLSDIHCTPREAGETAAAAGAGTLVLTHLNPFRDTAGMRAAAEDAFDGPVRIAEDGLSFSL